MEKKLFKALASFQRECPVILKDTQAHQYKYADWASILEVVFPLMEKHELGFYQLVDLDGVRTVLFHEATQETIESVSPYKDVSLKGMNDFQAFGSQITYLKRYALGSILGVVTDTDNDAQGEQTARRDVIKDKPWLNPGTSQWANAVKGLKEGKMIFDIEDYYKLSKVNKEKLMAEAL